MVITKHLHLPNFRADVTLSTDNGDAHSKLGDHPEVMDDLWGNVTRALKMASDELDGFPFKEVRLAEGCK